MKKLIYILLIILLISTTKTQKNQEVEPKRLDFTCTACVIVATALINGVGREREALRRALQRVCTAIPPGIF
jgi:hypothetical protein